MAQPARILVSVEPSHPGGTAGVANALRAAGASVGEVLEELGTITATCAPESVATLSRIPGVLHIEAERAVAIPPPDSKVQ